MLFPALMRFLPLLHAGQHHELLIHWRGIAARWVQALLSLTGCLRKGTVLKVLRCTVVSRRQGSSGYLRQPVHMQRFCLSQPRLAMAFSVDGCAQHLRP